MTPDEARPIMEQLAAEARVPLPLAGSQLRLGGDRGSPCALEKVSALKEHRWLSREDNGKCVQSMTENSGNFEIRLEFAEDLPRSPGTMRLWLIYFTQIDLKTDADVRSFFSAIIEKYGPATFTTPDEIIYCSETAPGKTCRVVDDDMHVVHLFFSDDGKGYNSKTNTAQLKCFERKPSAVACQFPPQLGSVGFYAQGRGAGVYHPVEIYLYDAAFASQSANEEARMIGETRTTGKPVL
jgi:hypothetical protein